MHPSVSAAIAIGVVLLLIFILVSIFNIWRRVAGGPKPNADEKKLMVGDGDNELDALVKSEEEKTKASPNAKRHPPGVVSKTREMVGYTPLDQLEEKIKEHLQTWDANEKFGIWDRNILHFALAFEQVERLRIILDICDVDINARTKTGTTTLYMAAEKNLVDIVDFLIERGADMNVKAKEDDSILIAAVKHSADDVVAHLFQKFPDVMKKMIDEPNRRSQTALYWAVKKGSADITRTLLENGATLIKTTTADAKSPLHVAVEEGVLQTVKLLFEFYPVKWGMKDGNGDTALHIAAMNDNGDVVEYLYERNDNLAAYRNAEKLTSLDVAEYANSTKSISVLGSADIIDPDTGKQLERYPIRALFKACKDGKNDTVVRLLNEKEDERKEKKIFRHVDEEFNNCLDVAIDNGHVDVATTILGDDEWRDALCNDNRWASKERAQQTEYMTPMRKLIRSFPSLAQQVLDNCCNIREDASDASKMSFEVDFDFRFIEDADIDLNEISLEPESRPGPGIVRDLFDAKFHKRYTTNEDLLKQNDPLSLMVEFGREDLLKHPLTNFLLEQRWAFIKFPFLVCTFFYVLLAASFTCLIAGLRQNHGVVLADNATCTDMCAAMSANDTIMRFYHYGHQSTAGLQVFIFILATFLFLLEFLGFMADGVKYFKVENLIENFVLITAILFILQLTECDGMRCNWQWVLASLTVFFAWMSVVIEFQVFADFGVFTLMFLHILKTFANIFLVLAPFIVGFAYAFYAVLNETAVLARFQNQSSVFTVMKVGVMTVGEINSDLFFDALVDGEIQGTKEQVVSVFFFILFLVVMPIIIMNLLVGLAVGDIGEIRDIAEMEKIKNRIETIQDIQYSRRNQIIIKALCGFLFRCFSPPDSWRLASIRPNLTTMNKLRSRIGAAIDPSAATDVKNGIFGEEVVTMESRINDLETSVKKEIKGVVKEDLLQNVKDELLEKIAETMQGMLDEKKKEKEGDEEE